MADSDLQQFREIRFRYSSNAIYLAAIIAAVVVGQPFVGLFELIAGDRVSSLTRLLVAIGLLVPLVSVALWLAHRLPMTRTQLVISPVGILCPMRDESPLPWSWVANIVLETPSRLGFSRRVVVVFRDDLDGEDRARVIRMNGATGMNMAIDRRLLVDEDTGATAGNADLLELIGAYRRRFSPPPLQKRQEDMGAFSSSAWTGLDEIETDPGNSKVRDLPGAAPGDEVRPAR